MEKLRGRYTISKAIGAGAMGEVYLAEDEQTGTPVAIKALPPLLARDTHYLSRFEREAQALRELNHPNIVPYIDSFEEEGKYYLVMAYMPGGSLYDRLKQKGALRVEEARRIAIDLTDALIRAHRLGIIHRDIKPENILFDADGGVRLSDFGVAGRDQEGTRLTGTGTQMGTPYYMSPEAWSGEPQDAQSDIWSLGVVIYEMLAGEPPFRGNTAIAVMREILQSPTPDIRRLHKEIPDGLYQIIRKTLAKDKNLRYTSMRDLGADLERGRPTELLYGTGMIARNRRFNPRWVVGSLITIMLIGLAAAFFFSQDDDQGSVVSAIASPTSGEIPATSAPLTPTLRPTHTPRPTELAAAAEETRQIVIGCDQDGQVGFCIVDERGREQARVRLDLAGQSRDFSWSPDGQYITFATCITNTCPTGEGTLYIVKTDGTDLQILPKFSNDILPIWSPDGNYIAFHSGCDLRVTHLADLASLILIAGQGGQICANHITWSPDSQWVAMIDQPENDLPKIWLAHIGGEITQQIELDETQRTALSRLTWTQAGELLFGNTQGWYRVDPDCYAAQCEVADVSPYTDAPPERWERFYYPYWGQPETVVQVNLAGTPTSAEIKIVTACSTSDQARVCIRDLFGHEQAQLELGITGIVSDVIWSGDGSQIFFRLCPITGCDPPPDSQLYRVGANGADLSALPQVGNEVVPSPSPDGKWLAYHSSCDLRVMELASGESEVLIAAANSGFCAKQIAWSTDSEWLAILDSPTITGFWNRLWVIRSDGSDQKEIGLPDDLNARLDATTWDSSGKLLFRSERWYEIDPACLENACMPENIRQRQEDIPYQWEGYFYPRWGQPPAPVIEIDGQLVDWGESITVQVDARGDSSIPADLSAVRAFYNDRYLYLAIQMADNNWTDAKQLVIYLTTRSGIRYQVDYALVTEPHLSQGGMGFYRFENDQMVYVETSENQDLSGAFTATAVELRVPLDQIEEPIATLNLVVMAGECCTEPTWLSVDSLDISTIPYLPGQ